MNDHITINNLNKKYNNDRGIFDISISLEKGDVLGLVGSNGSGKTTLMKALSGILVPDSGEVNIFGYDINLNREEALYKVGTMIESPSFYSYLTAQENLYAISKYYPKLKISNNRIENILKKVGLYKYKNEKIKNYSVGMKQRLGLAMTMINNPNLYILDEPTNGLDMNGVSEILTIIGEISSSNQSAFIISSHISSDLEKICNKIAFINEGRINQIMPIESIIQSYGTIQKAYELYCITKGMY